MVNIINGVGHQARIVRTVSLPALIPLQVQSSGPRAHFPTQASADREGAGPRAPRSRERAPPQTQLPRQTADLFPNPTICIRVSELCIKKGA